MNKFILLSMLLLFVSVAFVSANLVVDNVAQQNPTFVGESKIFSFSILNNNTFPVYKLNLTPIDKFTFSPIPNMLPGQVVNVSYSVYNNVVSSGLFISTLSYFYDTKYNVTSKNFSVNILDSGFSNCNVTLMQNDSVVWFNNRSNSSEVKSISGGWSNILLSPLASQSIVYPNVGSWTFYIDGFPACYLNVLPYNDTVSAHDSFNDVAMSFNLVTTVNPSSLVLHPLNDNFSSYNNQTQVGYLEVKNNGAFPLYNIVLSDSKGWISFAQNNFTREALTNQPVFFNLTPLIFHTNESNITHTVTIYGTSSNGGNSSINVNVFIPYTNLDNSSSGAVYDVKFYSPNETAVACHDNRIGVGQYKTGFEWCTNIEVQNNVTVVRDVPATATLTEAQVKAWADAGAKADSLVQNNINAQGITQDYITNTTDFIVNNIVKFQTAEYYKTELWMNFTDRQLRDTREQVKLFWICFSIIVVLIVATILLYYRWKYNWACRTLQWNM